MRLRIDTAEWSAIGFDVPVAEFVAADAAYALQRYATTGAHQQYYQSAESYEAVDDLTLTVPAGVAPAKL